MKSDRNDDDAPAPPVPLVSAPRDAAEPNDATPASPGAGADHAQPHRRVGDPEATTSPDPIDIERLILSLERTPIPPAPTPDERPMSNGGRFVAYHATGRPARPHTEQEARRRALAGLSVFVNATPVPQSMSEGHATGSTTRQPARAGSGVWLGAAAITVACTLALLVGLSASHEAKRPVASAPAADPIAPVASRPVVAEPTLIVQATSSRETREPVTGPSAPPARLPPARAVPRRTLAGPPTAASTEASQPKKPAFADW